MEDATMTAEENDTFECTLRADERVPNDFHEWPEPFRKVSDSAVAALLAKHPGATVISETSQCIDDTHPRFPEDDEHKGKFWLIRTIKLDKAVVVETRADTSYSAAIHLRQFEDQHFGPDAVRIGGQIERGSGSRFSLLPPARRREYVAIERLVEAEQRLTVAAADLAAAQAQHDAAVAAVDAAKTTEGEV